MRRIRRSIPILLVVAATACSGSTITESSPIDTLHAVDTTAPAVTSAHGSIPPAPAHRSESRGGDANRQPPTGISEQRLAGRALGALDVYAHPTALDPMRTLPSKTLLGTPTVVRILGSSGSRLQVSVPGRPNGTVGWVERDDVETFPVLREVVIDLSDRVLVVTENGTTVFEAPVGVGSPASPTPIGSFFITDAAIVTEKNGPWGPFAFGLSARSETVTEFNGGDGIIGIHGTNRPGSVGRAQSLGCIRLDNDTMTELFELLSVGTPVEIRG